MNNSPAETQKTMIASTPEAPYFAVIFTTVEGHDKAQEYHEMSAKMLELATDFPGFLGIESVSGAVGITVSYWKDGKSIQDWRRNVDHLVAQKKGREQFYASYKVRVCHVVRDYEFEAK